MFQLIETMGLQEKQEEAVKGYIRGIIWREFNEMGIHLSSDTYSELVEKKLEKEKSREGSNSITQFIEV